MKCPYCGVPEIARVKVCQECGEAFASEDILEYHQLEYLINETASWENVETLRRPYEKRFDNLRARLQRVEIVEIKPVEEPVEPIPVAESRVVPEVADIPEMQVSLEKPAPKPVLAPPKEKVPFDQWLLSERNIKIALYSGGLLLVLAGLIFIGVNWVRISGPVKFAITSLVTGLMYLGGFLLFQRDAYRIGGIALLAVASGFLTLNFAVLQIYVLGPSGLHDDVMWLIASPLCLLLYMLTAYWTRSQLFSYISIAALISTLTAALVVAEAPEISYFPTFSIFFLVLLLSARGVQESRFKEFTFQPLWIVAHIGMPLVLLISIFTFSFAYEESWLYTSPIGLLFYLLAAYWTRSSLLTYISLGACISMVSAILTELDVPYLVFTLVYSILMLVFMYLGFVTQKTQFNEFTRKPLQVVSNIGTPIVLASTLIGWLLLLYVDIGNNWLAILTFGFGVLFYGLSDGLFHWLAARWAAAFLFALTFTFILLELDFPDSAIGIALMVLSLGYLGIGYFLEQKEEKKNRGLPLYGLAYIIAGLVTIVSIPEVDDLILALFGDVILIGFSAAIHRDYKWVYGAVWLFMLPIYLTIGWYVPKVHHQGLLMGVLGLNYLIAGYLLGRRELRLGGPFLTAAAFLSILVVALTWSNALVVTLVLALVGILYLFAALWLDWTWLLLPSLVAANLMVLTINEMIFYSYNKAFFTSLVISYACFGLVLVLGGFGLRRNDQMRWAGPLYLVGIFNLAVTYLAGFLISGWLAVALSSGLSILFMSFAWVERQLLGEKKLPSLLTYIGTGIVFVGHFFLLGEILPANRFNTWPGYTAALCAVLVGLAWLLRREPLKKIYSIPLRRSGTWLIIVPIVGSIGLFNPILVAVTFGIAGITFTVDAALRRILNLAYVGIGAFIVMIWAILMKVGIEEPQAYTIPVGAALLAMGWNERRRGGGLKYRIPTILGLFVLMGSAFIQSLPKGGFIYAILLLGESILAIFWGIRIHSRGYVQLGGVALIANAIVQLGPGFVDLPRWVQIGVTGVILLGGGMGALIKREEILTTRQKVTEEWRSWEP